jgi:hypothetical protein
VPGVVSERLSGWSSHTVGRLAGWLVIALALGFLGHELWRSNLWVLAGGKAADLTLAIIVGTLSYGLAGFLLAEAWRHLLGPGPPELNRWRHCVLYGRTQIAKYLPGNCFHFVGRQVLGRRLGHQHGALALASVAEVVSQLLVGGALALPAIWSRVEPALEMPPGWVVLAMVAGIVVLIALSHRHVRDRRARLCDCGPLSTWAPRVAQAGLLHAAFFGVAGLVLWGVAAAIGGPTALGPITAISTMAMAWWVGFVTPGASAGVGVREAVLVLALGPKLGSDGALLVALALRVITTCGDLVFFALCSLVRCDTPQNQSHAVPPGS